MMSFIPSETPCEVFARALCYLMGNIIRRDPVR